MKPYSFKAPLCTLCSPSLPYPSYFGIFIWERSPSPLFTCEKT